MLHRYTKITKQTDLQTFLTPYLLLNIFIYLFNYRGDKTGQQTFYISLFIKHSHAFLN